MRCPKCGYISFDHNQICPKCNKDISEEQAKLNLPTYKSDPPALLGMLVGDGNESNVGFTLDSEEALRSSGVGLDFEETSSMMEGDDIDFDGDQDLEISLTDDTGDFDLPEVDLEPESDEESEIDLSDEDEELSLDMDEASFEDSDDTADDLELDLGEVSMEDDDEDGEVADSLDGISPNESIVLGDMSGASPEAMEETMEMDALGDEGTGSIEGDSSTVELNVSDLKINETGELEINSIPDEIVSPGELPEEDEIKIDDIDIDSEEDLETSISIDEQADDKNETGSLELSDLTLDSSDDLALDDTGGADTGEIPASEVSDAGDEDSLDLGDLIVDDDDGVSVEDDDSLDLSDLTLGESGDSDDEDMVNSETMKLGSITDDGDSLDLDDLAFDEDGDDESFDLSGIALDDTDMLSTGEGSLADSQDLDHKETGELQLSDLEETDSGQAVPPEDKKSSSDDDIEIDLENLDLDLDLDDK